MENYQIDPLDRIYYDSLLVITYFENDLNPYVFEFQISEYNPIYNFRDVFNEITTKTGLNISHAIILAESGLEGKVYRYNNYGDKEIYITGETKGYA